MKRIIVLSLVLFSIFIYCKDDVYSQDKSNDFISLNTTDLTQSFNSNNINFENVNLQEEGDIKTIEFELENNSNFDAVVEVLVNGEKEFTNEYISISCSDIEEINKHSKKKGIITIKVLKTPEADQEIPYNISINAEQKM